MNIFDIATFISKEKCDISYKFKEDPQFIAQYNQFMLNRILSCDINFVYLAVIADKLNVSDEIHYIFWHNVVEKKFRFFRYPKKNNDNNIDDIKVISNYYNVSFEKATELIELLTKNEIDCIKKTYIHGKR